MALDYDLLKNTEKYLTCSTMRFWRRNSALATSNSRPLIFRWTIVRFDEEIVCSRDIGGLILEGDMCAVTSLRVTIKWLGETFGKYVFLVFENGSTDNTIFILESRMLSCHQSGILNSIFHCILGKRSLCWHLDIRMFTCGLVPLMSSWVPHYNTAI